MSDYEENVRESWCPLHSPETVLESTMEFVGYLKRHSPSKISILLKRDRSRSLDDLILVSPEVEHPLLALREGAYEDKGSMVIFSQNNSLRHRPGDRLP